MGQTGIKPDLTPVCHQCRKRYAEITLPDGVVIQFCQTCTPQEIVDLTDAGL